MAQCPSVPISAPLPPTTDLGPAVAQTLKHLQRNDAVVLSRGYRQTQGTKGGFEEDTVGPPHVVVLPRGVQQFVFETFARGGALVVFLDYQ